MNASNEDAESVDAFLERIASLKDRREREDEERTRKLEEDILQGRRERQARRAERTRSLSPTKNSLPPNTSLPSVSPYHHDSSSDHAVKPPTQLSPLPRPLSLNRPDAMIPSARDQSPRPLPPSPTKFSAQSRTSPTGLSRSGTLSWQQRPSSRDSNTPRSRPISRHTDDSPSVAPDATDEGQSRDRIALSLGSKDPSWFRQSADRGASSSAYRKSREASHVNNPETWRPLPGMPRDTSETLEKAHHSSIPTDVSTPPLQANSAPDPGRLGSRFSSMSSQSMTGGSNPPLPIKSSQRLSPPAEGHDTDQPAPKRVAMSSSQGQPSSDRPSSPTKGLGGFVQSAMMKRSDSVNKRWSAQAVPGLSRGNSVASYRGGHGYSASIASGPGSPPREAKSAPGGQASSPSAKSRPTSSHSTSTVLHNPEPATHFSLPPISSNEGISRASPTRPPKDFPSYIRGPNQPEGERKSPVLQPVEALPVSPSKMMDPKRWSPTKASWLESALARPDSPKLTSPKPQTPSWMADLQKSKLSQEESEPVKSPASSFTMVSPAVLMRSSPPGSHVRPFNISGLSENFDSGLAKKVVPGEPRNAVPEESQPAQTDLSTRVDSLSSSPAAHILNLQEPLEAKDGLKSPDNGSPKPAKAFDAKKQPPPPKDRPQTPQKTDFRANLRPRQAISEESLSNVPEFKNVFGKLKRTETKNYVAPDELKGNILRGKAALNLTAGPQKPNTIDEFKESITKKKESMKSGVGLSQKGATENSRGDAAIGRLVALPEALVKRDALTKSINFRKTSLAGHEPDLIIGTSRSVTLGVEERRAPPLKDHSYAISEPAQSQATTSRFNTKLRTHSSEGRGNRDIEGQALQSSAEETQATDKQALAVSPGSSRKPVLTAPETTVERKNDKTAGNLASRLNPGLAGILQRVPTSSTSSKHASSEDVSSAKPIKPRPLIEDSNVRLTHMTKARARGPKRRLPNAVGPAIEPDDLSNKLRGTDMLEELSDRNQSVQLRKHAVAEAMVETDREKEMGNAPRALANLINLNDKVSQQTASKMILASPVSAGRRSQDKEVERLPEFNIKEKTKPMVGPKSPTLRKVSSPPPKTSVAMPAKSDPKPQLPQEPGPKLAQPIVRGKNEEFVRTFGGASSLDEIELRKSSAFKGSGSTPSSARSPRQDFQNLHPDTGTKDPMVIHQKPTLSGLGLKLGGEKTKAPISQLTPPPEEKGPKGWDSWKAPARDQGKGVHKTSNGFMARQQDPDIAELLADFFDESLRITSGAETDAQAILLRKPTIEDRSKTLKIQASLINAEGKKEDLPPHQEHILFDDCMYLFIHSREKSTGSATTEVYLWSGDGVSEAAIEDAQLFCRKEARENNAKLELLRQGKEPAKFFQALGGIVITRRSRNSALYMLCGRRHLGHIAFDEVDLDAACLCSGFSYLVSAKFGKLYLWKGKGSGADEVGCARLIGMDLGLTGEIEEVEEGREPPSFFDSLGVSRSSQSFSPQWSLRSTFAGHACRLFRVELEQNKGISGFWTRRGSSPAKASRASLNEVQPFCQRDLDSHCIYVLDAYFNIFVYVGDEASAKSTEFVTALMFAQEYGILAASLEDRPSIPSCHVTFYGAPPDFTAAFRKWQRPAGFTSQHQKLHYVLPLNETLEVLSRKAT